MHMKYLIIIVLGFFFVYIACSSTNQKTDDKVSSAAPKGPNGERIYRTYCVVCHGIDGRLEMNGAKDLNLSELTLDERIAQITNGKNLMTPFEGILSSDEIQAVAKYTLQKFNE